MTRAPVLVAQPIYILLWRYNPCPDLSFIHSGRSPRLPSDSNPVGVRSNNLLYPTSFNIVQKRRDNHAIFIRTILFNNSQVPKFLTLS